MLHIASVLGSHVCPDIRPIASLLPAPVRLCLHRQQGFVGIPVGLLVVVAFSQQFQQCAQREQQWQSQQQQQCEQQQRCRAWISSVYGVMLGMKMAVYFVFRLLASSTDFRRKERERMVCPASCGLYAAGFAWCPCRSGRNMGTSS